MLYFAYCFDENAFSTNIVKIIHLLHLIMSVSEVTAQQSSFGILTRVFPYNSIVLFANRIILHIFAIVIQIIGEIPVAIEYYGNTN